MPERSFPAIPRAVERKRRAKGWPPDCRTPRLNFCMFRNVAQHRTLTPGYAVVYPNRERATSKTTKAIVVLIMLVSVGLMLILTIGGWSKLQGLKPVNFIWCAAYLVMAFYIATRWARGLLPITTGLAMLLLIMVVIAGTGAAGVSWFDRNNPGFGSAGLSADFLGLITVLLIPVQILLIFFTMLAFGQGWNVEVEVPIEEAKKRGYAIADSRPGDPATA